MLKNNELNNTEHNRTAERTSGKYKLDAECGPKKNTPRNTVVGAISLGLSVLIAICNYSTNNAFWSILSILLVLAAVGFFTAEVIIRAKLEKEAQIAMDEANQAYFEDAEVIPVFSTERMFRSASEEINSQSNDADAANNSAGSLDTELGFLDAVTEFVAFAEERGCKIETTVAQALFASLASSRIMVVRQMPEENFALLVRVMSAYFGTQACIDRVDCGYTDARCLLFASDGESQKTPTMLTLEAAQAHREHLHFIALTNVIASSLQNYFLPFINYAKAPEAAHFLSVKDEESIDTYRLPANLWVILNLAQGERVASLPEALLEVCSINDISVSQCDNAELPSQTRTICCSQWNLMIEKSKCDVSEGEWKKLDAFTNYLDELVPFAISNKQWVGMETYIAVLTECGENTAVAFDAAISARIVPSALAKAFRADKKIDLIAGLSTSFGDGEISISRKAVKELSRSDLRN